MNKPSLSFVKWLTKRDVEKILEQNGYEINYDLPTPYSKFKSEDGYYYIYVKCTKNKLSESEMALSMVKKYMLENNPYVSSNYLDQNVTILEFSDFMLSEFVVSFDEDEATNINRNLTKNYHKYMVEKFGTFYNNMKKAYIKKLYNEDKKNEVNEEIEKEEN